MSADQSQVTPDPASSRRKSRSSAATIYDVAELAGVNPSTVSRALSKPGRVSAKTESRIRAAAAELHFRINPMARALPTGRTQMLSLVVADITNPMIFGLVRGAEKAATAAGYALVIAESQESGDAEAEVIEHIMPSVDGIVLATTRLGAGRIVDIAQRKPLVTINRLVDGVPGVLPDVESGVRSLVTHLCDLGHTSIAYVNGPEHSWISQRRWDVLLDIAEDLKIAVVEIGPAQPTIEGGHSLFRRVQASRVSAVIAFNDLIAIGLMQSAAAAGVSVPDQLSVAGFDDIFGSDLISPGLTTVRAPLVEAGERAVRDLIAQLAMDPSPATTPDEPLHTELIVRGSTGAPQKN